MSAALAAVKEVPCERRADAGLQGETYMDARSRVVREFSGAYLSRVLAENQGNVSAAARAAGMDRSNFKRLLHRYRVDRPAEANRP